jgi:N-acetylglucosamine-6-sulfatase
VPRFRLSSLGAGVRRRGLDVVVAFTVSGLAVAALQVPQQSVAEAALPTQQPNVVLITTDDQTASDLRYMPFTRRLFGGEGVTFTDAVSPYPWCCPARATILTGQLSHNHGVVSNKGTHGGYEAFAASPQYHSHLGHWLQQAGYRTMFVGKYLNQYSRYYEPAPGWDEWNATVYAPGGGNIYDYFGTALHQEDGSVDLSHVGEYQTDVLGEITRDFIVSQEAADDKPFFVWESNLAPHSACRQQGQACIWGPPQTEPEDDRSFTTLQLNRRGAFNERVVREKPVHIRALSRWGGQRITTMTHSLRQRARSLRSVDRSVQATVNTLEATGELENTLIIFTSDNGFLIGEHRWQGKVLPYEPSLRVPLLMRGPGVPAGVSRSDTAALVDVAPTIADATGATPTFEPDGRSLLPLAARPRVDGYGALSIEAGPQQPDDFPVWFYRGVRTQRYTYVHYPGSNEYELYDRRSDPDQMTNVAYRPAYRRTRAALQAKLAVLRDCVGQACYEVGGGGVPEPRPERYLDNGATVHPDELGSIGSARQVVTITGRNWRTGRGRLTAWTRRGRTWTVRRGPFDVRLGANGLVPQRFHRRGTAETPAGTFTPERAFGLRPDPGAALQYDRVSQSHYWVHDPQVPRAYNINQPRRRAGTAWRASRAERWADHADRFPHALLMRYNLPRGVVPSARHGELRARVPADVRRGSFVLHVGRRLGRHGWVSMSQRSVTWLLRWMRPADQNTTFVVGTPQYLRGRL